MSRKAASRAMRFFSMDDPGSLHYSTLVQVIAHGWPRNKSTKQLATPMKRFRAYNGRDSTRCGVLQQAKSKNCEKSLSTRPFALLCISQHMSSPSVTSWLGGATGAGAAGPRGPKCSALMCITIQGSNKQVCMPAAFPQDNREDPSLDDGRHRREPSAQAHTMSIADGLKKNPCSRAQIPGECKRQKTSDMTQIKLLDQVFRNPRDAVPEGHPPAE
jgi:hypothetical protein